MNLSRLAVHIAPQPLRQLLGRADDEAEPLLHRLAADLERVGEAGEIDAALLRANEVEQIARLLPQLLGRPRREDDADSRHRNRLFDGRGKFFDDQMRVRAARAE